jgi:hypothetical protein
MVSIPGNSPSTTPDDTLAFPLVADQVPPGVPSVNLIDAPEQRTESPVMAPAFGSGLIVIVFVAMAVPQILFTVYRMVSVPVFIPVTMPDEDMVALLFVVVHNPPVTASDRETVAT